MPYSEFRPSSNFDNKLNTKDVAVYTSKRYRGRGLRTETRTFYILEDESVNKDLEVNQEGIEEFIDYIDDIYLPYGAKLLTITGISNSKGLTVSFGNGEIALQLPASYLVNELTVSNGSLIPGDPGDQGEYGFIFDLQIPENSSTEERYREIIVTGEDGAAISFKIYQEGTDPVLELSEETIYLSYMGEEFVTVTANSNWSTNKETTEIELTLALTPSSQNVTGLTNTNVSIMSNPSSPYRGRNNAESPYRFYLNSYTSVYKILNVILLGVGDYVEFDQPIYNIDTNERNLVLTGKSNSSSLTFSLGGGNLVTILPSQYIANGSTIPNGSSIPNDPGVSVVYSFSITIPISENTSLFEKTRQIVATTDSGISSIATIEQEAFAPVCILTPNKVEFNYIDGSTKTVTFQHNGNWQAVDSSGDSSLVVMSPSSGVASELTNTPISLALSTVVEYTGRQDKESIKQFSLTDVSGISTLLTIIQSGKPEFVEYDITEIGIDIVGGLIYVTGTSNSSKLTFEIVAGGGSNDLPVTLPSTYTVNGSLNVTNGSAISGDPGLTAQYTFSVSLNIPENTTDEIRTAIIRVTDNAGTVRNCLLRQISPTPSLIVNPSVIIIPYEGTTQTATVNSRNVPIIIRGE